MFSQLKWRKTIFFFILLLFLFLFYLLHVTAFTQKKEKKKIEQTESDIKDCLCSVLYIEQV